MRLFFRHFQVFKDEVIVVVIAAYPLLFQQHGVFGKVRQSLETVGLGYRITRRNFDPEVSRIRHFQGFLGVEVEVPLFATALRNRPQLVFTEHSRVLPIHGTEKVFLDTHQLPRFDAIRSSARTAVAQRDHFIKLGHQEGR